MKHIALIIFLAFLSGCVGYRLSHVHGILDGNSISTPYGKLNGNVTYDALTCFGNCPAIDNLEVIDASPGNTLIVK